MYQKDTWLIVFQYKPMFLSTLHIFQLLSLLCLFLRTFRRWDLGLTVAFSQTTLIMIMLSDRHEIMRVHSHFL